MDKTPINLFQNIPEELNQELVEKLIEQDSFRLERIVSRGQISPPDFWYDPAGYLKSRRYL
jgi:cupin 2 domain-containing protein